MECNGKVPDRRKGMIGRKELRRIFGCVLTEQEEQYTKSGRIPAHQIYYFTGFCFMAQSSLRRSGLSKIR